MTLKTCTGWTCTGAPLRLAKQGTSMQICDRPKSRIAQTAKAIICLLFSCASVCSLNSTQNSALATNALPQPHGSEQGQLALTDIIKLESQEHAPRLLAQNTDTTHSIAQSITLGKSVEKSLNYLLISPY